MAEHTQVELLRMAVRWLVEDAYPDEEHETGPMEPDGDSETFNPRYDMLTRMAEDENLPYVETVPPAWPWESPVVMEVARVLGIPFDPEPAVAGSATPTQGQIGAGTFYAGNGTIETRYATPDD